MAAGFLSFDVAKGEYSGAMFLEFQGGIAVKAFGLLTTRMPDGGKGYSLVVIISAEGFTPIQLGFGFTLTGIGGLLAINRTFDEDGAARRAQESHAGQRDVPERSDPQRAPDPQQSEQGLPAGRAAIICSGRWCRSPGARRR